LEAGGGRAADRRKRAARRQCQDSDLVS
jgi:hypothetical protein